MYKITIEVLKDSEEADKKYPTWIEIFMQRKEEIDLEQIILAINEKEFSDKCYIYNRLDFDKDRKGYFYDPDKSNSKEASPGQIIEINKNDPSTWTKKPNKKEKDNE